MSFFCVQVLNAIMLCRLLAFFDVRQALQTLTFIGYPAQSVSECAHLVKKGSASASLRNAIHCFVYGSTKCGKSGNIKCINWTLRLNGCPQLSWTVC